MVHQKTGTQWKEKRNLPHKFLQLFPSWPLPNSICQALRQAADPAIFT
jgi:hypothetical protein